MSFNNAVDAKQQGVQYLSTAGAWVGEDGGTAGNVLTSNGTGVAPTFQAAAAATYYSLTPYIVGADVHSQFTTIQAAINQAVTDGASKTAQANIYIKPGSYTENLTLADGINLIAFDPGQNAITGYQNSSVILVGSITINTTGNFVTKISGIKMDFSAGGTAFPITVTAAGSQVFVSIYQCELISQSDLFSTSIAAGNALNLYFNGCFCEAFGAFMTASGATLISDFNTSFFSASTNTFASGSSVWAGNNGFYNIFSLTNTSSSTLQVTWNYATVFNSTDTLIHINSAANCSFGAYGSNISCQKLFDTTSSGSGILSLYASFINPTAISSSTPTNLVKSSNEIYSSGAIANYTGSITNYKGSIAFLNQSVVHTTNATVTTLITVPVPAGTSVTVTGQITGANAAHTDMTGAQFFVMADGTAAAIVGAASITQVATSTGAITATFSGGNLLIQVAGLAGTNYNWVGLYTVQPILTNA